MRLSHLRRCLVCVLLLPALRAATPVRRPVPKPLVYPPTGQAYSIPLLGLEMAPIPAGTFMLGSPANESGHQTNEGPQERVTLSEAFWMGKYLVTQTEWIAEMGSNPSTFKGGTRDPVENVSWDEVVLFCKTLTTSERAAGRVPADSEYRLPTAAEWEYACRAGTTGPYAGKVDEMAWSIDNSGRSPNPVGTRRPNEWTLFDMHGDVWEWCLDWSADRLPATNYTNPLGPEDGTQRVAKGGAWDMNPSSCRSAARTSFKPADHRSDLGFRIVLATKSALIHPLQLADPLPVPDDTGYVLDKKPPEIGLPCQLPGLGLELRPVLPGNFTMGSPSSEPGHTQYESPQTRVGITRPFWLGKYAITQGEWQALMGTNPGSPKDGTLRLPINNITWDQAVEYCHRLTERESAAQRLPHGYIYRMPTEAEWEYTCRAGTTGSYSGSLNEIGWYDLNSLNTLHPVGQKQPNPWGFYDLNGNVSTWCGDWMTEKFTTSGTGVSSGTLLGLLGGSLTDPAGPFHGEYRIYRGGSWNSDATLCRSGSRAWAVPTNKSIFIGLRVALAQEIR